MATAWQSGRDRPTPPEPFLRQRLPLPMAYQGAAPISGLRAAAAAVGRAGIVSTASNVSITGVRATSTASGRAGTPKVAVGDSRAAATAAGRAGVAQGSTVDVAEDLSVLFSQKMTIVGLEFHAVPAYADWTVKYALVGDTLSFPSVGVADTFNRVNSGPPPGGWTTWSDSGLKILSNQLAPNDTGVNDAYWNFALPFPNVETYITIVIQPATGGSTRVYARMNPAGGGAIGSGYAVVHTVSAGTDSIELRRYDASTATVIGGPWALDLANGDKIGIRCRDSIIEAHAAVSGLWRLLGAVTDSTYAGTGSNNKLGLYNNGNGTSVARYDNFGGTLWRPTPP